MMLELYENVEAYRIFVYVMVTILGFFIGSFLNVVALRLLKEESIVSPPSHCPNCKESIKFYDNIPVLSYIILGGKCRHCKEKISIQYPIVEFATGFLFLLTVISFGLSIKTIGMMIVISMLVVITVTDLKEQYIFDVTSLSLVPIGLLYNLFNLGHVNRPDFVFQLFPDSFPMQIPGFLIHGQVHLPGIFASAIVGIIVAIVFFEGLSKLSEIFLGKYGFGMGDTKMCMGLAAWFGWEMLVLVIIISFLAQALFGIPMIFHKVYQAKDMKSFYALLVTLVFSIIPIVINLFKKLDNTFVTVVTMICFVIVLIGLFIFMKQSRERETLSYLPLGPALVLGAIVVIFYGEDILNWYLAGFNLLH